MVLKKLLRNLGPVACLHGLLLVAGGDWGGGLSKRKLFTQKPVHSWEGPPRPARPAVSGGKLSPSQKPATSPHRPPAFPVPSSGAEVPPSCRHRTLGCPEPPAARAGTQGHAGEDGVHCLTRSSACTVPEAPGRGTRSPRQSRGPRALCPHGPVRGPPARLTLAVTTQAGGALAGVPGPPGPAGAGEEPANEAEAAEGEGSFQGVDSGSEPGGSTTTDPTAAQVPTEVAPLPSPCLGSSPPG